MKIPPKLVRETIGHLRMEADETGSYGALRLAEKWEHYARPAPKKTLPGLSKSVAKRLKVQTRKEKTSAVREAVMKRAAGFCEGCGSAPTAFNPLELDHFRGGSLKRSRESVAGCWALGRLCCHRPKTLNRPNAEYWRAHFRMHLTRNHLPIPGDL